MLEKNLSTSHDEWPSWVAFLHRHRLENLASWLLESSGPLAIIGAQLIYLGGPLMQSFLDRKHMDSLALVLEDRDEGRAFLAYLQEESA